MTTYAWPLVLTAPFWPSAAPWGQAQNQRVSKSSLNGATQSTSLPGMRWVVPMSFQQQDTASRQQLNARLSELSGLEHRAALYHFAQPVPRGTCNLSGVTVSTLAAQFATTLLLAGCGNVKTLLAGDMLSVTTSTGSQLVMVRADATSNAGGAMTIEVRAMLRGSVAASSAVVLDHPTALFSLTDDPLVVPYGAGNECPAFTVQFEERFS